MPIEFTDRFVKQYAKLPVNIQNKVDKALRFLDNNFLYPGLHSHPVEGTHGIFEAYVYDKCRMTFGHNENIFLMRNVDNHDECLRKP